MSLDGIQARFIDEIQLRGYDDKFIDKNEEREILQIAIQQGIGLESARAALIEVCGREGYLLESDLIKSVKDYCEIVRTSRSKVDLAGFESVFNKLRADAKGRRAENELLRLVIVGIEDSGLKVKASWPFGWYRAMKRQAGLMN